MIKNIILGILLLLGSQAEASECCFLLDRSDFELWRLDDNRDSLFLQDKSEKDDISDEEWYGGAAILFDVSLISTRYFEFYWDNRVFADGTRSQYRHVGWWWETGFSIQDNVDVYWRHTSRHAIDVNPNKPFYLRNSYGMSVNLYRRDDAYSK